ncbi:MAG: YbaN family protein [Gemmatimonadales bacterium]
MNGTGPGDLAEEKTLATSQSRRWAYVMAGHTFVALGVIGAFLPIMPTTIFLILAASCYGRGSAQLHRKLMSHRTFGPILHDWEANRAMTVRTKAIAISAIVVGFAIGAYYIPLWWIRIIHITIGLALISYLANVNTKR